MSKKYSLALGGGSAKWLVHIWVLQYLEEQNIEVTEIAGTSMGSIIGSAYALGIPLKKIEAFAKSTSIWKMVDIDLKLGFLKGKKAYKFFETIYGDKTFEDTKIPLKITATNLETGELEVFTSGKIIDAVRASISLPGIFKPHTIDGHFFIDGGVTCNLPVDLLSGKNKIAVSAIGSGHEKLETKKKNIFGFEVHRSFFSINYQILYRSITILMAQNEIMSIKKSGENIQVLQPKFWKLNFVDFDKVDKFKKLGYDTAKENLKL